MRKTIWVGPRQSDIDATQDLFSGSVTIFGDGENGNIAYCNTGKRINHNLPNVDCDRFFIRTLEKLCVEDDSISFMFYDPIYAYQFGEIVLKHSICLNSYGLLRKMSNKQQSRIAIKNICKTIPFVILSREECTISRLKQLFAGFDEFVLQETNSCGGEGTIHISEKDPQFFPSAQYYLASPYIANGISVNTHIVIFKDGIEYLPWSIQIVSEVNKKLLYSGADYICFHYLTEQVRCKLYDQIVSIGEYVKRTGYLGVLGVDFIVKDNQVYFMEFNPRFQGSSQLINIRLQEECGTSLQQLNYCAFMRTTHVKVPQISVGLSNCCYTTGNVTPYRLKQIIQSEEPILIQHDGFQPLMPFPKDSGVYLNRVIFNQNICTINNDMVILHPNIFIEDTKRFFVSGNPLYQEYIKFALINHGVSFTKSAVKLANKSGTIKNAVFDAVDFVIFGDVYVNAPSSCKLCSFSPFVIDNIDGRFVLKLEETVISTVSLYFEQKLLAGRTTSTGVPFDAIIHIATDRIRINPAPVCTYKRSGNACKFCNLPTYNVSYCLSDIREVIDFCVENLKFRHFLIGGGTFAPDESGWDIIAEIASYITDKCEKPIYLMTIPPDNTAILDRLQASGITEVAFNLEIVDRKLAARLMPGKGSIPVDQYYSAFIHAVKLWGRNGSVRSLLIYGLDRDEDFLQGINSLCEIGVEPIISVFRPLQDSELSYYNPPPTSSIISIFIKSQLIAQKYSLSLGPDCIQCRNNTLSLPSNSIISTPDPEKHDYVTILRE